MDEPREQPADLNTSHTANGDHSKHEPHPVPSARSAAGNRENRPDFGGEHHDMVSEPNELIDACEETIGANQDGGYQPFIERFTSPPRMAPMTTLEAAATDDVFAMRPQTSPSSECVSDPAVSFEHGLKTEDFIRSNDRKTSATGKSLANIVDDLFDALQATQAAEIEAARLGVLDRNYPPLAPETAASPNRKESAVAQEMLIDFEDHEASSYRGTGRTMVDGEAGVEIANDWFRGCSGARSPDSRTAPGNTTDLTQDHDIYPRSNGPLLPATLCAPIPTLAASAAQSPHRAEAQTALKEQVELGHPSTGQESPRGESHEPVPPEETMRTEQQVSEEQAPREIGRQYKKNRKTKAKLKRRRVEQALKEADRLSNGGDARDDHSITGVETVSQPLVQPADMPTPSPASQVTEDLTPTHATASAVADAVPNDKLNPPNTPDTQKQQLNTNPTQKKTKTQGQGARQRKRRRELRNNTLLDLISFDDDE
ncbi:MAG: hypothetical protein Q9208_001430 [Pyrenodesmia sp. 3 TL-2023]